MDNNKHLDGIKKLDSEDLRQAREIVLKSIGEKEQKDKEAVSLDEKSARDLEASTGKVNQEKVKQVDGLKMGRAKEMKKIVTSEISGQVDIQAKTSKALPQQIQEITSKQKVKQAIDTIQPTEAKQQSDLALPKKEKIIAQAKPDKQKDLLSKKDKKIKEQIKKDKKLTPDTPLTPLPPIRRAGKRGISEEGKDKKDKTKKVTKSQGFSLIESLKLTVKLFYNIILLMLLLTIISYISFVFILHNFNLDNQTTRTLAQYLPVPALISEVGIVEYYDYQDARIKLINDYLDNYQVVPGEEILAEKVKEKLIKELVINELARKYNITPSNQTALNAKIALDQDINYTVLVRMNKLKQMIEAGEDFYQVARRYGDDYNMGRYYNMEEAKNKFGLEVLNLEINQLSNIIITSQGYYLVQLYDKQNDLLGLKYIFLKAKYLDDYCREEMLELRVRSFVD